MNRQGPVQTKQASAAAPAAGRILQRKCACGNHTPAGGECARCRTEHGGILQPRQAIERSGGVAQAQTKVAGNRTGMPDTLKAGLERISGIDLSAVRVRYNSSQPAQLSAFAYTRGTEIHVAPGEEKHLPHEAWHAVQQLQGRVNPTTEMQGFLVNNDAGLEREADVLGARAQTLGARPKSAGFLTNLSAASGESHDEKPFTVEVTKAGVCLDNHLTKANISTGASPVVQRAANFVAGTVTATTNLASHFISGARDAGFTPPTLNGTATLSVATAQGAIKAPTLGGSSKQKRDFDGLGQLGADK